MNEYWYFFKWEWSCDIVLGTRAVIMYEFRYFFKRQWSCDIVIVTRAVEMYDYVYIFLMEWSCDIVIVTRAVKINNRPRSVASLPHAGSWPQHQQSPARGRFAPSRRLLDSNRD